jgi:hypothetical protein
MIMKALLGTAAVAGSLALLAPSVAVAQTPCAQWDLSQGWTAVQGNYYSVDFHLLHNGSSVSGTASFLGDGYHAGEVTGTIKGNSIELVTSWGGVYLGRIDATGRIDGTTYDKRDSTSSAVWYSNRRMNCRATATPPPGPLSVPDFYVDLLTAKGGITNRTAMLRVMTAEARKESLQGRLVAVAPSGAIRPAPEVSSPARAPNFGPIVPAPESAIRPAPEVSPPARNPKSGACKQGYVYRKAGLSDRVCVTQRSAARVAEENRTRKTRLQPGGGAYGPNTCRLGFVWREAFPADLVCVTPKIRTLVAEENRIGPSRRVR